MYFRPAPEDPIDQGDIIDGCPLFLCPTFDIDDVNNLEVDVVHQRVIVLTQTCDLANRKVQMITVAAVREAQVLVDERVLKPADIRGPIRAGRVYGWYFLPKNTDLGLAEAIVDLRQLHTVRLDLLTALCRRGQRRARVQPLYREHLARHLGDTYSRIGLPETYPTE